MELFLVAAVVAHMLIMSWGAAQQGWSDSSDPSDGTDAHF